MNAPHEARLYRALQVLAEDVDERGTKRAVAEKVAVNTHVGYQTARAYLHELVIRGWARITPHNAVDYIAITRAGMAQLTNDEVARATIKDEEE